MIDKKGGEERSWGGKPYLFPPPEGEKGKKKRKVFILRTFEKNRCDRKDAT